MIGRNDSNGRFSLVEHPMKNRGRSRRLCIGTGLFRIERLALCRSITPCQNIFHHKKQKRWPVLIRPPTIRSSVIDSSQRLSIDLQGQKWWLRGFELKDPGAVFELVTVMKLSVIGGSIEPHFVDDFKPAVTEPDRRHPEKDAACVQSFYDISTPSKR
jgi:hypothetical protein